MKIQSMNHRLLVVLGNLLVLASICITMQLFPVGRSIPGPNIKQFIAHVQCITGSPVDSNGQITTPGHYRLSGNVTGPIIITADNVILDLNGYVISNQSDTASCGILIDNGVNVTIKNGTIGPILNTSTTNNPAWEGRGLAVVAACSSVLLQNLKIKQCANNGIDVSQSSRIVVQDCTFDQCYAGFYANQSDGVQLRSCRARSNTMAGIELYNCSNSNLLNCVSIDSGSTGTINAYGIVCSGGSGNIIDSCYAQGTTVELTTTIGIGNPLAKIAAGIVLQDFENGSIVQNSVASNTQGLFGASAYGLLLKNKSFIPTTSGLSVSLTLSSVTAVAWNPDGAHVAIGTSGAATNELYVYAFDGTRLTTSVQPVSPITNISSVAWSPDGQYLAVGRSSGSNRLYLYGYNGQVLIGPVQPSTAIAVNVNALAWSPSGQYLVVGSDTVAGKSLSVYSWNGQWLTTVTTALSNNVKTVAWSSSGNYVAFGTASASNNLGVYLWNGTNFGSLIQPSTALASSVNSVSWNPNGQALAVGLVSTTSALAVYAFNGQSLSLTASKDVSNTTVNTVSWSPDGQHIAAGTSTALAAYTWNGTAFAGTSTQIALTNISSVAWSPDAQNLLIGKNVTSLPAVSMYGWNGATLAASLANTTLPATRTAAWSPCGGFLAVVADNGSATVNNLAVYSWNGVSLGSPVTPITAISSALGLSWRPDGKYFAVGTSGGTNNLYVYPWNGQLLGTPIQSSVSPAPSTCSGVSWSPDGKYIAIGQTNASSVNNLRIFSFDGTTLSYVASVPVAIDNVQAVAWSPDGNYLAVGYGTSGNGLRVYSWNGSSLYTYSDLTGGPINNIFHVSWSPKGNYLTAGSKNSSSASLLVCSWDGASLVQTYSVALNNVYSVSWHPDGKYIATAQYISTGSDLTVWEWNGTSLALTVSLPLTYMHTVAWSLDGQYLAAGVATAGATQSYCYIYPWSNSPSNCTVKNNLVSNTVAPTSGNGFGLFGSAFADTVNNNQATDNSINYGGGVCNIQQGYSSNNFTVSNGTLQNIAMP